MQVNDHNERRMKLAAYIHLQQRLRMHGDIPPLTHTTSFEARGHRYVRRGTLPHCLREVVELVP